MITREALHKYRKSTTGEEPHVRVFFFHAHIYYDPEGPQKAQMLALHKRLQEDFKEDPDVEVHTLQASASQQEILMLYCLSNFQDDV